MQTLSNARALTDNEPRLPARLPECPQHGRMTLRPSYTPEQEFCGTWYQCNVFRCGNTVLLPSPGLLAQLDQQRRNLAAADAA